MSKPIAIIPARAGSKGIPGKNIMDFCGKHLIGWSIECALNANIDDVYVSTDGADIAEISKSYGAKVINRPKELSTDTASSESALVHALDQIDDDKNIDAVVFLQATSPIRRSVDIQNALKTFYDNKYDSLFSMCVLEDYCIWSNDDRGLYSLTYDFESRGRRQDRASLYLENGSIYIFKPDILRRENNRLGGKIGMYEMPFDTSYEIDSDKDVEICKIFMRKYLNKGEII